MGRKAKPWYRKSHGAWYATVGGERTHLVTGPKAATEAQAHEAFRRMVGAAVDPRVQRIVDVLRERPELITAVLQVIEAGADSNRLESADGVRTPASPDEPETLHGSDDIPVEHQPDVVPPPSQEDSFSPHSLGDRDRLGNGPGSESEVGPADASGPADAAQPDARLELDRLLEAFRGVDWGAVAVAAEGGQLAPEAAGLVHPLAVQTYVLYRHPAWRGYSPVQWEEAVFGNPAGEPGRRYQTGFQELCVNWWVPSETGVDGVIRSLNQLAAVYPAGNPDPLPEPPATTGTAPPVTQEEWERYLAGAVPLPDGELFDHPGRKREAAADRRHDRRRR